jgi:CRP/FNR family transcriptional regulator, cyclic AMP receptor protein
MVQVSQEPDSKGLYKCLGDCVSCAASQSTRIPVIWPQAIKSVEIDVGLQSLSETAEHTLKGIELFSALDEDQLATVESHCRWRLFASHQQIIDRESSSRDVFFVISGKVRIVNYSYSGRGIILDELEAGNYFGELSAIDSQPRSARVISMDNSLIASLPQKHFLKILEDHPKMTLKVMEHLSKMLRSATQRIMELSTLGANNRVHADLLRQAGDIDEDTKTAVIDPMPIHNDIASRVSTTRETVARIMNDLARKGIVEKVDHSLLIKDVQRLQDMVEEVRGE